MRQLALFRWRPLTHPPRRLWVLCSVCHYGTFNEDRHLKGWQESVGAPRRYRCDGCSAEMP